MSSEVLRRAAALMRERAEAATSSDKWLRGRHQRPNERQDSLDINYRPHVFASVYGGSVENRDHIASWHPAVALAVADWLDVVAERWDTPAKPTMPQRQAALTAARAYLGETEPTT